MIIARRIPAFTEQTISFQIDDQTEYLVITASGSSVTLTLETPNVARRQILTGLRNIKAIKLSGLSRGTYKVRVRSKSDTTLYVVGKTDFFFKYGFSQWEPRVLEDTTPQPVANDLTYLSVSVVDPKHTVRIVSAQILDMNERVKVDLPLRRLNNDFYTTGPFSTPTYMFKVAVSVNLSQIIDYYF
ncbi:uncharacterized protein LOC142980405 [Anticarsia gemmatalis]|uniref:uncharacterized protein LOC142980405 n=1 Tax=Anticarsia gemmatalis TaxID=129554 RepID=UPI003F7678FC